MRKLSKRQHLFQSANKEFSASKEQEYAKPLDGNEPLVSEVFLLDDQ